MAKGGGGKRRTYTRDANGRFASTGGGTSSRKQKAKQQLRFRVVYHGTTPQAAASIKRSGFKVDPDGIYGPGVYAGTRSVAKMYGSAVVPVRVQTSTIRKTSGSSRQIRQYAETAIKKGETVRFPHTVGDTGKTQSAYVIPPTGADRGIVRQPVMRSRKAGRRRARKN